MFFLPYDSQAVEFYVVHRNDVEALTEMGK